MMGLCPFHDERTPSFSVNVDDKLFHCFGCGEGGDLIRFVELTEGVDFPEAVQLLADRAGIELRDREEDPQAAERKRREKRLLELLDRTNRFFERQLWDASEAQVARDELRRRGLDPELLRAFRVGYAPSAWDRVLVGSRHAGYTEDEMVAAGVVMRARDKRSGAESGRLYDRFRRRITFPLADRRGRILGFGARAIGADQKPKYVNSSDGPVYHKGRHLFAAHLARKEAARTGQVILCEGYTDVIALHQAGLTNAVGLMGTALTPDQVRGLGQLAPTVVLALDSDRAGRGAMLRAAELAKGSGLELRVVLLSDGMDPADLLVKRGTDAIRHAFADPMAFGRFHVRHVLDEADLSHAEGKDRAIAELRPVFAGLPPGVLRMELMAEAAGRLRLDATVLGSLVDHGPTAAPAPTAPRAAGGRTAGPGRGGGRQGGGPAGGAGPGRPAGGGWARSAPSAPPAAAPVVVPGAGGMEDVARAELSFLAECWAAGPEAAPLLTDERLATLMAGDAHRAAARALRDGLAAERAPAPPDDSSRLVLDLVGRMAGRIQHPSCAAAELAGLRLELGVLVEAQRSGRPVPGVASPHDLALRRIELQRRIDRGVGELLKSPRRGARS